MDAATSPMPIAMRAAGAPRRGPSVVVAADDDRAGRHRLGPGRAGDGRGHASSLFALRKVLRTRVNAAMSTNSATPIAEA